jgi:hypothetical protein
MRTRPLVATSVLAVGAALVASAAAPAAAGATRPDPRLLHLVSPSTRLASGHVAAAQSTNWFGYNRGALTAGHRFTSIAGDWAVPTATAHTKGQSEASSTWIGIGGGCIDTGCNTGAGDETLIQAGTEQDVSSKGTASYDAWWEIIPEPETPVSLPVHPGDKIHVAIAETLPAVWSITIANKTTGKSFSTTTPYPGAGLSAEWIEETPLELGTNAGFSALPNLTTVHFSNATVNGAAAKLKPAEELDLVDGNGKVYAVPSAPDSTGNGFDACTWTTTCS